MENTLWAIIIIKFSPRRRNQSRSQHNSTWHRWAGLKLKSSCNINTWRPHVSGGGGDFSHFLENISFIVLSVRRWRGLQKFGNFSVHHEAGRKSSASTRRRLVMSLADDPGKAVQVEKWQVFGCTNLNQTLGLLQSFDTDVSPLRARHSNRWHTQLASMHNPFSPTAHRIILSSGSEIIFHSN